MAPFAGHGPFRWSWPLSLVMVLFVCFFFFAVFFFFRGLLRGRRPIELQIYMKKCFLSIFLVFIFFEREKKSLVTFFSFFFRFCWYGFPRPKIGVGSSSFRVWLCSGGFSAPCANRGAEKTAQHSGLKQYGHVLVAFPHPVPTGALNWLPDAWWLLHEGRVLVNKHDWIPRWIWSKEGVAQSQEWWWKSLGTDWGMIEWKTIGQMVKGFEGRNLVDPASSHMLVSKIKPCMSQHKLQYGETANGSLKQL